MNRNLARSIRSSALSSMAFVTIFGSLVATMGCTDNRLPPVPVPKAEMKSSLPKWYPENPWTAKEGQSQIFIEGKIVFDTGSATIHKFGESEKVLKTLLQFLTDHPDVTRVRVEGHTDDRGQADANQKLSAERSLSVCNWLVDNGVNHMRLLAVGFGSSKPLGPNELAEGRAENRRTEFHVAELEGKPFLGKDPTAGGLVLDVPSLEERKMAEEAKRKGGQTAVIPTLKFKATGNEVKKVQDSKVEVAPNQPKK